ncbi:MAG: argininosuccinate lyase, partial [Halioglobus sp.]|nr:argininosuccinate lyase [Halioglobus sp.]
TARSRNDQVATDARLWLRDQIELLESEIKQWQAAILKQANAHQATILPGTTHQQHAQPISLSYHLMAYFWAFQRHGMRLAHLKQMTNASPLGSAALAGTPFPIDREQTSQDLGFDGPMPSALDATSDRSYVMDALHLCSLIMLDLSRFANEVVLWTTPEFGFLKLPDHLTTGSSIMPQKRNPRPLDRLRSAATAVIGSGHTVVLNAHNTNSGMNDYRDGSQVLQTAEHAGEMYRRYKDLMTWLVVIPERALAEIDADYSTMTEVADVLLREAGIAFREGHHYASELTTLGRAEGKRPKDLSDAELGDTWRRVTGSELPLPIARIRAAMDPQAMVASRRGRGGPQPAEVERMLQQHRREIANGREWLRAARAGLSAAARERSQLFESLL